MCLYPSTSICEWLLAGKSIFYVIILNYNWEEILGEAWVFGGEVSSPTPPPPPVGWTLTRCSACRPNMIHPNLQILMWMGTVWNIRTYVCIYVEQEWLQLRSYAMVNERPKSYITMTSVQVSWTAQHNTETFSCSPSVWDMHMNSQNWIWFTYHRQVKFHLSYHCISHSTSPWNLLRSNQCGIHNFSRHLHKIAQCSS